MHRTTQRLIWAISNYHGTHSSGSLVGMARAAWVRADEPNLDPAEADALCREIYDEDKRFEAERERKDP